MIKTGTIRTFLLIFLTLTVILPILSTFLFLGSILLASLNDSVGSEIMKYGAVLIALIWIFVQSVFLLFLGMDRLCFQNKEELFEENDLG